MKINETVEFIRICAQVSNILRNYANDISRNNSEFKVEFLQSMYGPDQKGYPKMPVGFSWEIEVLNTTGYIENTYALDVTYEESWSISGERLKPGEFGQEKDHDILYLSELNITECTEKMKRSAEKLVEFIQNETS